MWENVKVQRLNTLSEPNKEKDLSGDGFDENARLAGIEFELF